MAKSKKDMSSNRKTIWGCFYPNECNVCRKRTNLKRCGRCRMISYCGEEHQKNHWPLHKDICKVIAKLTKEKKLSHLYEDLRDCSLSTWIDSRREMCQEISSLLDRDLERWELQLLQYPRSCFVCYDTRQENLTNCTKCPLVAFCEKHLGSTLHDELCADIIINHSLETEKSQTEEAVKIMYKTTLNAPPDFKKMPSSTYEYLDEVLKVKLNRNLKMFASTMPVYSLTIFGVLQKLNKTSLSTMTIYIELYEGFNTMRQFIENLFHLLPNLNHLTIVSNNLKEMLVPGQLYLCSHCTLRNKKLTFQRYDDRYFNQSIDLAVFFNLDPPDQSGWQYPTFGQLRHISSKFACPVVLTTNSESKMERVRNYFLSVCHHQTILYDGDNNFSAMLVERNWEDWRIAKNSQFMIIAESTKISNSKEDIINSPETGSVNESVQPNAKKIVERFYPGICHFCKSSNAKEACTRCKMVFYCCKSHMKMNQSEHKDICKVILGLLTERGTPHLFDNLPTRSGKSWLEAKLNFLKLANGKLNRNLWNFEKQIFLFPRTCFVCHESDLSVLKNCKCGVSLCKIHRDDTEHKNLCEYFHFNLKWGRYKENRQEQLAVSAFANKRDDKLLPSMDQFIDRYFRFNNYRSKPIIQNPRKVVISDFLTRSLTFIYAVEKLQVSVPNNLYVHVVGALNEEFENVCYWHSVITWFNNNVTNLYIDFIGIDLNEMEKFSPKSTFHFLDHPSPSKHFTFSTFTGRYEEYFINVEFRKPDIVIGYNLDLHESNLGVSECTWKKTLSIISKMNVPFFMTAMSEDRGRKSHEMISSILGETINYDFFGKNPYASLMPERDYETERLCYSNSYLIGYKQLQGVKIVKIADSLKETKNQSASVKNKNSASKTNLEKKKKITEMVKTSSSVKDSGSGIKKLSNKKTGSELSKLGVNNEGKVEKVVVENSKCKIEAIKNSEELLHQNLQLKEENKILKENLRLKEENERLKNKLSELRLK